jgi:hypothetical protein
VKKEIAAAIYIKNLALWAVISACCLLALGVFAKSFLEDRAAGKEIFLPGVLALSIPVTALLVFGVTRVVKHARRLRGGEE